MSLEEMRKKIDEVDDKIVRLIAERIRDSQSIGDEKKKSNKPVEDAAREEKVLAHIKAIAREEKLDEKAIQNIYRQIIKSSKGIQGIEVAFQGETGAYSEEAAFQYFGHSIIPKPCETFDAVFEVVENDEAPFGVVPIENSLEGSISRVYDLLLNSNLKVMRGTGPAYYALPDCESGRNSGYNKKSIIRIRKYSNNVRYSSVNSVVKQYQPMTPPAA